jgi:hypothetical protein
MLIMEMILPGGAPLDANGGCLEAGIASRLAPKSTKS